MLENSPFKALHEGVLYKGWRSPADVDKNLLTSLGAARVSAWFERLYRTPAIEPNPARMRLVNKFSIGSDPEYAFMDEAGRMVPSTSKFGLNAGPCFGADGNCRLAELRAAPSRSALRVTASLLKAMRLLACAVPQTCKYSWVAYPYIEVDGVGGHVHFGRRRVTREREVRALDTLAQLLKSAGVFDEIGCSVRRANTPYGRNSDVREQPFGYEYRTYPTYLGSPWMTFLVLTAAKLAAHSSVAFPSYDVKSLKTLFAVYKAFDDDALLAWKVWQRKGLPMQHYSDFRPAWGLPVEQGTRVEFVAPSIAVPTEGEVEELYNHFAKDTPLAFKWPAGLDTLACKLPDGYSLAMNVCAGVFNYGWAEILAGLAVYQPFTFSTDTDESVEIWHSFSPRWDREVRSAAEKRGIELVLHKVHKASGPLVIAADKPFRSGRGAARLKEFLRCGLFPIWPARTVAARDYQHWFAKWGDKPKGSDSRKYNFFSGRWEECAV